MPLSFPKQGFMYHILLASYAVKSNVSAKLVDHVNIGVQGHNISSVNMFGFLTHCYLRWESKYYNISTLGRRVDFSPSSLLS